MHFSSCEPQQYQFIFSNFLKTLSSWNFKLGVFFPPCFLYLKKYGNLNLNLTFLCYLYFWWFIYIFSWSFVTWLCLGQSNQEDDAHRSHHFWNKKYLRIKGTVAWDFWTLVFFMNQQAFRHDSIVSIFSFPIFGEFDELLANSVLLPAF